MAKGRCGAPTSQEKYGGGAQDYTGYKGSNVHTHYIHVVGWKRFVAVKQCEIQNSKLYEYRTPYSHTLQTMSNSEAEAQQLPSLTLTPPCAADIKS